MRLSPHEIAHVAVASGFSGNDPITGLTNLEIAVAVALAESDGDADAMHMSGTGSANYGQHDHGLWQISGRWSPEKLIKPESNWRDPYHNGLMAYQVWKERVAIERAAGRPASGWGSWSVFTSSAGVAGQGAFRSGGRLEAAKFAVAAPVPALRPEYTRGPYAGMIASLDGLDDDLAALASKLRDVPAILGATADIAARIGGHFT